MIQSMTGYGKGSCCFQNKTISVELRSLNSKQMDINTRMPFVYKNREMEIRNEITKALQRGKVDVAINIEDNSVEATVAVNKNVVKAYYSVMSELAKELSLPISESMLIAAMRMPDSMKTESIEVPEEEWNCLVKALHEAIENFNLFRKQEGEALSIDIIKRIGLIREYLNQLKPFEEERIIKVKERLSKGIADLLQNDNLDKNRFEQELIFYLEKLDITEEKVRLSNHCDYFKETMKEDNPGRKLGFITQEIGREINTIGSKANNSDIQKLVVMMKDELEKVKEQLLNIL